VSGASDSTVVKKGLPCPDCGSKDNLALYDDGHTYCFGMGCQKYTPPEGAGEARSPQVDWWPANTRTGPIAPRRLTRETCEKWGYLLGEFHGKPAQFAIYRDEKGAPIAAKVRMPGKDFTTIGDMKEAPLYGMHLWNKGGKKLVITEGEIDAMSVSQAQRHKYPVVSIPNGAQSAVKAIKRNMEWVSTFDEVVLWFDADDAGHRAAEQVAKLFKPGKVRIVKGDLKDANEYLKAGRDADITNLTWRAEEFRPDGIVRIRDVIEAALRPVTIENPWWLDELTRATYGRRFGECYAFGAGTGVGKTDWLMQQIEYDVNTMKQPVGLFLLEQNTDETATRIAGKTVKKLLHIPPEEGNYTQDEKRAALEALDQVDLVYLYDHFGVASWDVIEERIRYLRHVKGVRFFYLDHLTALATGSDDKNEKEELERIMAAIGGLVKELQIVLHFVSHLTTPDGTPHEEGGRVQIKQFKGSRSIGFWSFFMFGLERNQQDEDEDERLVTTFRILKDRYTGRANGKTIRLRYDPPTGILNPDTAAPPARSKFDTAGDDAPF
jgi:twinkle protein